MLNLILTNVIYPLAGRLGTSTTAVLVTQGVSQQHADWLALGLMGLAGVAWDLGAAWLRKRSIVDKTFRQTVEGMLK